jgi:diguanylate cyclase (GGDEF)-like protein/PAS domain S-box-containing protein
VVAPPVCIVTRNKTPTTVLLVEDDPADAQVIQSALAHTGEHSFCVEWVTRLSDALERLGQEGIEVVLLDLTLPDGQGIEAFDQVHRAAPNALILVLSGSTDDEAPRLAMERGAHDYLAKAHIDAHWLPRALHYVIERKAARDGLRESEARFRAMSDASPLGIFVSDAQGACTYTNAAYQEISGLTLEQTLGTNWSTAVHPEDRQRVLAQWLDAARGREPFETEFRFQRRDDSVVWTRVNGAAMWDGERSRGHVQTVEDITERKSTELVLRAAEEEMFEEKERAQVTLNSIGDGVLTTDLASNVTYMNPVAEKMTGWPVADALGRPLSEVFRIVDAGTRNTAANPALRAISGDRTVELAADCLLVRRDGSEAPIEDSAAPIHKSDGQAIGAVIVFHDVSQAQAMAQKMSHQAQHDFLTGLPNRMLLTERLSQAIGQAHRHRKQVALLFIDLDYFKHINDSLGHAIGDELLKAASARLTECVRATDTVCRQGGDEFVILLTEIERPQDAAQIADKVLAAFGAPQHVGGHELHVTLSIGISVYPDDGTTAEALTQSADTAMYHAKANGRNRFQFFMAEMNTRAVRPRFVERSTDPDGNRGAAEFSRLTP